MEACRLDQTDNTTSVASELLERLEHRVIVINRCSGEHIGDIAGEMNISNWNCITVTKGHKPDFGCAPRSNSRN